MKTFLNTLFVVFLVFVGNVYAACETPRDTACFKLGVTPVAYSDDLKELVKPQKEVTPEARYSRHQNLGKMLTGDVISGKRKSAAATVDRHFLVYTYGSTIAPVVFVTDGRKYYPGNGNGVNVTDKIPEHAVSKDLGKPQVWRVVVPKGMVSASMAFPRDELKKMTFLFCSEEQKEVVYPGPVEKGVPGMWHFPEDTSDENGKNGDLVPFVFKS